MTDPIETTATETPENQGAGTLSLEVSAVIPLTDVLNNPAEDMPPVALIMMADGTVRWATVKLDAATE